MRRCAVLLFFSCEFALERPYLRLGVGDGREMDCLSLQSCCRVALCRCVLCAWLCDWRQRVVVWMFSSECAGRRAGRGRPTPLDGGTAVQMVSVPRAVSDAQSNTKRTTRSTIWRGPCCSRLAGDACHRQGGRSRVNCGDTAEPFVRWFRDRSDGNFYNFFRTRKGATLFLACTHREVETRVWIRQGVK